MAWCTFEYARLRSRFFAMEIEEVINNERIRWSYLLYVWIEWFRNEGRNEEFWMVVHQSFDQVLLLKWFAVYLSSSELSKCFYAVRRF